MSAGTEGKSALGCGSGHLSNRWWTSGRWPVDGALAVDSGAKGMPADGAGGSC